VIALSFPGLFQVSVRIPFSTAISTPALQIGVLRKFRTTSLILQPEAAPAEAGLSSKADYISQPLKIVSIRKLNVLKVDNLMQCLPD
jgi:hypothetical protein